MVGKKVIFSIFAGRQKYLSILKKYLDILISKNLISEVHLWYFTSVQSDTEYLEKISNENDKYFLMKPIYNDYKTFDNDNRYKWNPYYKYYYENISDNTILIKCDDDILYIDINRFEDFINNINDDVLYFPNIINNDVCAYFQQKFNIHNLFDYHINENLIYEIGHSYPLTDWYRSFDKACQIHDLFLNDKDKFLLSNKDLIDYGNRISINFFACNNIAVKKIFLDFLERGCGDDETYFGGEGARFLLNINKINKINLNFTVLHFQFGPQDGHKLDTLYLYRYDDLANNCI